MTRHRKTTVDLSKEEKSRDKQMNYALEQWGLVYRGGYPGCALSRTTDEEETHDELLAARVEAAMVKIQARRYQLYRLARLMYLGQKPNIVLCSIFRCSERKIYEMRGRLFACLEMAMDDP